MEIRYPNYYKTFRCIAGACPDTCCAGWEISVDKESEKRYRKVQKTTQNQEFGKKLRRYVKGGRIWEISGNPRVSVDRRMAVSLALAHDVQRRMGDFDYTGIAVVLKRYSREDAAERFWEQWDHGEEKEDLVSRFLLMSDFMSEFSGLETICREWPDMLETCRARLYHLKNSRINYRSMRERLLQTHPEAAGEFEKVFGYFVYSFVLSALYDGDVLTKMKMAALCTMAVEELYMAADTLDPARKVEICHGLARQIENSDENRGTLERFLKQEIFSTRRMIDALM